MGAFASTRAPPNRGIAYRAGISCYRKIVRSAN